MGTCRHCKIRHPDFYCPVERKIEKTAYYLYNWLVDHKICCEDDHCLCNASTPSDGLADLFDETKILDLAEACHFSDERIKDIIPDWEGWGQ